jgi:hypothetical protein
MRAFLPSQKSPFPVPLVLRITPIERFFQDISGTTWGQSEHLLGNDRISQIKVSFVYQPWQKHKNTGSV